MKKFVKLTLLGVVTLAAACAVSVAAPETSYAQGETHQAATPAQNEAGYNYVAQTGDSYTKMARKAVQTYGLTSKVKLSGAQIVYAETNLTLAASSPYLNVGQNVSLKKADVKAMVDKAIKLTEADKAKWEPYAATVDFNTNNVGEAR